MTTRGPRNGRRKDANHQAIADVFIRAGCDVMDLSELGNGRPDLLVTRGPRYALVEVKVEKGTLKPAQEQFRARWPVRVIRDEAGAQALAEELIGC